MVVIIKGPGSLAKQTITSCTLTNVHTNETVSFMKNLNTIALINIR